MDQNKIPIIINNDDGNNYVNKCNRDQDDCCICSRATKARLIRTFALYITSFSSGIATSMYGATLLDLKAKVGVSIDQAALMITCYNLGRLPGILVASIIFDRFSTELSLVVTLSANAMLFSLVPWCPMYALMITTVVLQGITGGCIGVGVNSYCLTMGWKKKTPSVLQGLHFSFASGLSVAPLLANQFICTETPIESGLHDVTSGGIINSTFLGNILNSSWNGTADSVFRPDFPAVAESLTSLDHVINASQYRGGSSVENGCLFYMPYHITTVFQLCIGLFWLLLFVKGGFNVKKTEVQTSARSETSGSAPAALDHPRIVSPKTKAIIITLLIVFLFALANIEVTYGGLVLPFCVSHLSLAKTRGNLVALAYWVAGSAARGSGIVVSRILSPFTLLILDSLIMFLALAVLSIFSTDHPLVIWICSVTLGLGIGMIFGSSLCFMSKHVGNSSKLVALLIGGYSAGAMVGPAVGSLLFRIFSPISFVYYLDFWSFVMLAMLLCIRLILVQNRTTVKQTNNNNNNKLCKTLDDEKQSTICRETAM